MECSATAAGTKDRKAQPRPAPELRKEGTTMERKLSPRLSVALAVVRDAAARAEQGARYAAVAALSWIDKKLERAESSLRNGRKGQPR